MGRQARRKRGKEHPGGRTRSAAPAVSTPASARWWALLPALATLAVYVRTLGYGFVLDDTVLFRRSASLSDLGSIVRGFATDVGALRKGSTVVLGSFYRPVFLAISTLYYQVVGDRPAAWHLLSILLAALVATQAVWLLRRIGFAPRAAALGAAVFALHPAHVGSVAWVSGLQDQLAAAFVLAAVLALLSSSAEGHPRRALALAALAYALALLCKEVSIALLPLIAVWALAWWRREPVVARRLARAAAVFGGVAIAYMVARVAALGGLAHPWPGAPSLDRALAAVPLAVVTYVKLLLWPVGFSFFRPERPIWGPFDPPTLVAGAVLVVLCALGALAARRWPGLVLPQAWFAIWLLPVLNFWALGPEWMVTDRYLYLPVLALPWALLAAVPSRWSSPALAAIAVVFALLTVRYAAIFVDERTFYPAMAEAEPTSAFVLGEQARVLREDGQAAKAEQILQRAVTLAPKDPDLLEALADLERDRGELALAEAHVRRALAERPADSKQLKLLALAYARAGDPARAQALLAESVHRWPDDFQVQLLWAVEQQIEGRSGPAAAAFAAASRLRPGDPALAGGLDAAVARLRPVLRP